MVSISYAKDVNVNLSNFNVEKEVADAVFFTHHCLPEWADIVE